MNFLNKVGDFVGKGIDTIKNQINKVQENTSQQNTNNLPKGIQILSVIYNEKEKYQNLKTDKNNNFNNKYTIIILNFLAENIFWGLGIGDWGLGIGDWAQSSIANPQFPIPNPPTH